MAYEFNDRTYDSVTALVDAMESDWERGKAYLLGGAFRAGVGGDDKSLTSSASYYERKFREDPSKGNLYYLKWLMKVPGKRQLCWMGRKYGNLDRIRSVIGKDTEGDLNKLVLLMLQEQIFGDFVLKSGAGEQVAGNVRYLERCVNRKASKFNRANILPLLRGILENRRVMSYDGKVFRTAAELAAYLQTFADRSRKEISAKAAAFYQDDSNLVPEFEAWLLNLGYQRAVSAWRDRFQITDDDRAGTDPDSAEGFVKLEDIEGDGAQSAADSGDLIADSREFEDRFTSMLRDHPQCLESEQRLTAFMADLIKDNRLQKYLITVLYRMDIARAISEADTLTEILVSRFLMRMTTDFGISEEYAKWAAAVWCECYGEKILNKKNFVHVYRR